MARKPTKKQKITKSDYFPELGEFFDPDYTRKSLEELKMAIEELQKAGFEEYELDRGYKIEVWAYVNREETDEEFNARVEKWQLEQKLDRERRKAAAKLLEEKERKEYERLRKKFENSTENA